MVSEKAWFIATSTLKKSTTFERLHRSSVARQINGKLNEFDKKAMAWRQSLDTFGGDIM